MMIEWMVNISAIVIEILHTVSLPFPFIKYMNVIIFGEQTLSSTIIKDSDFNFLWFMTFDSKIKPLSTSISICITT